MLCCGEEDFHGSNSGKRRLSDQTNPGTLSAAATPTTATQATSGGRCSMSRASSVNSVNAISCSSASSAHNTDDDDSDAVVMSCSLRERRREAHTQAEQMRRDAIKRGYEELQAVNPMTSNNPPSAKLSKATILQKSLNYIQYSDQQRMKDQEVKEALLKEVTALHIIKKSYEQMVRNCQDNDYLSNQEKFYMFQQLIESLFSSFDASVDTSSFEQMSNCVFAWLENHCTPMMLKELVNSIMSSIDLKKPFDPSHQ